jgi:hypothetical protein
MIMRRNSMGKKGALICIAAAMLVFGIIPSASADTYPEVMLVLDASGSMWGRVNNTPKIQVARKVMREIIPSLPKEVKVGLTVYGHRKKGDCSDIEIIIEPGSNDRQQLIDKVTSISPKGMTPIADSITMVVDKLKGRESETTIILISDGEETCQDDPCGVVKALKASGIKFILHVVGFDVTNDQRKQLQCLADVAEGNYCGAADADSLLAALTTVTREVEKKVKKAKVTTKKKGTRLGKLHITFPGERKSIREFKIIRVRDGKVVKTVKNPKNDSTHPLLAGDYKLVAGFANPNYRPNTEVMFGTWSVAGGEAAECFLGTVAFNIADGLKSMPVSVITVSEKETGAPTIALECRNNDYYLFKSKPVVPGVYSVSITYYQSKAPTTLVDDLEVKAGATAYVTIDSGITIVRPKENAVTAWALFPAGEKKPLISVKRRWDNEEPLWRVFAVLSGKYDLSMWLKGMDEPLPIGEGIHIQKGELLEFDTGM